MGVVVDDILLREPNLLTPGSKPVGPVKIDWSNSVANGLSCVLMLTHGGKGALMQLHGNATITSQLAIALTNRRIKNSATSITNTASSTANAFIAAESFSTLGWHSGLTVLTIQGGSKTDTDLGLIGGVPLQIWLDTSGGNLRPAMYNTGTVRYGSNIPVIGGIWNITSVCSVSAGDVANYWVDGKHDIIDQSLSTGNYDASAVNIFGVTPAAAKRALLPSETTWATAFYVWNRVLSDSESKSMSADPYQFLIPA